VSDLDHEELDEEPVAGISPTPQQHFAWRFRGAKDVLAPVITTLFAFFMGGLVVALTGKSPVRVYHAIFTGTGIGWFFQVGNHSARVPFATSHMWFPWDTSSVAASNLQQTLLFTTPIILTALAVAFAFRCGMFNIGGQGQYIAGTIFAVWLGSSFASLNPWLHVLLCVVAGTLAGAAWAGIAGILKATVGAHEVITTIMLNWIAIWVGSYLFGEGGPLQGSQASIPVSNTIVDGAKLWGNPKVNSGGGLWYPPAVDSKGRVWVSLGSGHLGEFDRRKCKGPLTGATAADGNACSEGWSFHQYPGPGFAGIGKNSAEASYYTWVDQHDTLGLGKDVPISTGNENDALLALANGKWVVLRVPYPMSFYAKGLDGRIDDPNGGWKARGVWTTSGDRTPWLHEGGKGSRPMVLHFQVRPNPLAD